MKTYSVMLYITLVIGLLSCKEEANKSNRNVENDKDILLTAVDSTLRRAVAQYSYLSEKVEPGEYPRTFDNDSLVTSGSGWWCSGFYPGTLLYLDEAVGAPELEEEAKYFLEHLKREQFNTSTHDLGFMMYCSFGNANRLKTSSEYDSILLNSAKSLITRYNDTVQAIRSWDSAPWNKAGAEDLVVIIDNMMNLELLFWATEFSGDNKFREIAIKHANKTMANHFRKDYSSYHEVIYDEKTGDVKAKVTRQGAADSSAWARGQVWGLYGYTVMYRETKDQKYLDHANNIADFILNHPNLPSDKIPYWDFNAPNIPDAPRDSSAAAILASALLELSGYTENEKTELYLENAHEILSNLLNSKYTAPTKENGGFLLKHGVGDMPGNSEVDVPLSYGDYYFVEAMMRYKNQ